MKASRTDKPPPMCKDCAQAFQQLMMYNIKPDKAGTVASGIRMAMTASQYAFQDVAFHVALLTSLIRRAFTVLTERGEDASLVDHIKELGVSDGPSRPLPPPRNYSNSQIHVYSNIWLRLNELNRLNPGSKSPDHLEQQLLQQLMNFYERGAFPQLAHSRNDVVGGHAR